MQISHSKATIFRKDLEAVLETMLTDKFGPSKYRNVKDFENKLSQFLNIKYSVVVNSGTSALHLSLLGLDIQKEDEVIVPSYAHPSILHALSYIGAKPVLVDINHNNYGINYEEVKKKMSSKIKAIYIPHLFGFPVDINPFLEFEIPIIEDITEALGAEFKDQKVGSLGTIAIASFTDEMMITTGQGGAVFTNNKNTANLIRELIQYYDMETYSVKYNYRLSDLSAALGVTQLKFLPKFIEKRQTIASEYDKIFKKNNIDYYSLSAERYNTYFRYIVKIQGSLDKTIHFMKKHKIETITPISKALHVLLGLDKKDFPNTELAVNNSLSLPIYPTLKKQEIDKIAVALIKSFFK